jgi:hypothetical protein
MHYTYLEGTPLGMPDGSPEGMPDGSPEDITLGKVLGSREGSSLG